MSIGAIFPGQGAQSVGMLAELADQHASVSLRFREASEVLGFDLWKMVQAGPAEALSATQNTQPILLTASMAVWEVWQNQAPPPALLAGHSLGEYSALCCAGALSFKDAVGLVRLRGQLMEAAVPRGQGAMAAVMGLDDEVVVNTCASIDGVVVAANFNAPGQVVIAGESAAVAAASDACKAAGAKRAVMLDVSGPFHSPLMSAAKQEFAQALERTDLQMPEIPVVHNVDASIATDLAELRGKLLEQIAAPVRWSACIQAMLDQGVDKFVESGPGAVLTGLNKRIARGVPTQGIATPAGLQSALEL